MFFLIEPSTETISRFITSQAGQSFSYSEVGATREKPAYITGEVFPHSEVGAHRKESPADYILDHNRIKLGVGAETYDRAIAALRRWRQFDLGWVKIEPDTTPLEIGNTVAIKAKTFGLWTLSACRIVYLINESGRGRKFGFAYGTLANHVERGEERFTIEFHEDGSVWYDILAFSRPNQFLVRLGYPLARMLQKRFAKESLKRMLTLAGSSEGNCDANC